MKAGTAVQGSEVASTSIRESIDRAPMSPYQLLIVGVCFLIVLAEGYDLLLMAFAVGGVAEEWGLNGSQTGILLSSALFGMAIGSVFVAPLADRIGRRAQTLACLALVTLAMGASAITGDVTLLALCRLLTGIGIGGLVVSLPVVAAEFSPKRRRSTMIALYTAGLPLGGVTCALIAGALIANYSWRASFVVGALLTLVLFIVVFFLLPESIDYLAARRPRRALESINATLAKMRIAPIDALPEPVPAAQRQVRSAVFRGRNGVRTALLSLVFFVMLAAFYFATSWTPRLLEQSGLSAQQGISGGLVLNLGGAAAALIFSALAFRFKARPLTIISFAGAAVAFVLMSVAFGDFATTLVVAVAVGMFTNACATGMFAIAPDCFPAAVRSTGVGFAAGFGRVGAIVAPLLAGVLIDFGWTAPSLFLIFTVPLVLGGIAVALIGLPALRPEGETESAAVEREAVEAV